MPQDWFAKNAPTADPPGQPPTGGWFQQNAPRDVRSEVIPMGGQHVMSGREVAQSAVRNIPSSAGRFVRDITAPIHSPIETGKGLYGLAKGLVQMVIPGEQGSEQNARAVGDFLKERYGGVDAIKRTIATDPVGIAADVAGVVTGGAGLAVKAAGTAGKVGRVAGRCGACCADC